MGTSEREHTPPNCEAQRGRCSTVTREYEPPTNKRWRPFFKSSRDHRKGNHVISTTIFGATNRRPSPIFNVGFWLFGLVVCNQISGSTWGSKQPEQTTRNGRIEGPPTGTGLVGYHMVPCALQAGKQTGRQTDSETDRQTGRPDDPPTD